jgi:hypothetical protein
MNWDLQKIYFNYLMYNSKYVLIGIHQVMFGGDIQLKIL